MVNEPAPDSPISNVALEQAAAEVATFWRLVQKRAPREVNRRVREVMEAVYRVVNAAEDVLADRVRLARELETISAELRGRRPFVPQFYRDGRLAVVWAWDPIKIRGAVDHVRIHQQFERYLARADRNVERLNYFLGRAGLDVGEKAEKKPWEQAYATMEEYREFLWGRVRPDIT
ncbi:MAG: hypothetical protein CVU56_29485 [Deltaproteobacteria bacterium HGW-Deltaproteobacteria-14]|nr:MAG: hypothetical protein CVU56_29485 [Deltaproteobacteria bacterium HGW-Deltaproteobacteria-14]